MRRYGWIFVAYVSFCFLAPFYMLNDGPITADRLALLWTTIVALGTFVNLLFAYGAGRWIVHKLRQRQLGTPLSTALLGSDRSKVSSGL